MDDMLKNILIDYCTEDSFCFGLTCSSCGDIWKSKTIPFSKAAEAPATENKRLIYHALYEREKAVAKIRASKQAKEMFNLCPICKHLVCNKCFLICSDIDMCKSCATRLGETGEPVLWHNVLEASNR